MKWFRRDNITRAAELNTMAYMMWNRRSKDPWNRLEVRLVDPSDKRSRFLVLRQGKASEPMQTPREVQRYIRKFFDNLLYNGSGAPDDMFLDTMNSVTTKKVR